MDDDNINAPKRIHLANLPTPIEMLERLTKELNGPEIYIKRDDLTGGAFSGNKIRKLEYIAAQAQAGNHNVLITCGGVQSNHARATAAVAAKLGLIAHLVLKGSPAGNFTGNLFLDYLLGARVNFIAEKDHQSMDNAMIKLATEYQLKGDNPLVIPLGASSGLGCWGYIQCMFEMADQFKVLGWLPDAIFFPTGSGGTHAGLIIGKGLASLKCDLFGVCVSENAWYFEQKISTLLEDFKLTFKANINIPKDDIHVLEDYVGDGYGLADRRLLDFVAHIARLETIILDPVYTAKAFFGMVEEIKKGRFSKKQRILFIHTGGIYGLFPFADVFRNEIFPDLFENN